MGTTFEIVLAFTYIGVIVTFYFSLIVAGFWFLMMTKIEPIFSLRKKYIMSEYEKHERWSEHEKYNEHRF